MRAFPQRFETLAPRGALLKGPHRPLPMQEPPAVGEAYLKLIRQCACLKCGMDPAGVAAHLRAASGAHGKASGTGKKPDDRWALPLCGGPQGCHSEQHKLGEALFWAQVGINPFAAAERLYAARGDLVRMQAVAIAIIAERGS